MDRPGQDGEEPPFRAVALCRAFVRQDQTVAALIGTTFLPASWSR